MEFDIFGIKKLKRDIIGLQVGLNDLRDKLTAAEDQIENLTENVKSLERINLYDLRDKLTAAEDQIENLTENVKSLERINLYGRGDEPEVIVENGVSVMDVVMRLYIDGEEFTIRDVDGLSPTWYSPILKKSIMVNNDIATVVIQQDPDAEDIYHIEYDKGAYVHQVKRLEKEEDKK